METKPLLYAIIGFLLGGLVVSIAATLQDPQDSGGMNGMGSGGMSMQGMSENLDDKKGEAYDKAFLKDMITHHEQAIEMAELSKDNADREEIKQLSKDIIRVETRERDQMKQWQKAWQY